MVVLYIYVICKTGKKIPHLYYQWMPQYLTTVKTIAHVLIHNEGTGSTKILPVKLQEFFMATEWQSQIAVGIIASGALCLVRKLVIIF